MSVAEPRPLGLTDLLFTGAAERWSVTRKGRRQDERCGRYYTLLNRERGEEGGGEERQRGTAAPSRPPSLMLSRYEPRLYRPDESMKPTAVCTNACTHLRSSHGLATEGGITNRLRWLCDPGCWQWNGNLVKLLTPPPSSSLLTLLFGCSPFSPYSYALHPRRYPVTRSNYPQEERRSPMGLGREGSWEAPPFGFSLTYHLLAIIEAMARQGFAYPFREPASEPVNEWPSSIGEGVGGEPAHPPTLVFPIRA